MRLKKKWIIISVLTAVIILAVGVVGGVVYAQTSSPTPSVTSPGKTLADRVATILGIDQSKVEAAFTQAQKEMQQEALTNRLQNLVTEGKITQEQATQYQQWMESRPDVPAGLGLEGGMGFPGGHHGMRPGLSQPSASPSATPSD